MLMKTHNPQNERIKRTYFTYLAEAKGFSEATLDAVAKALNRFETYTKFRDFKAFHIEQAKGFKASLAEQMSARTKDRLSKTGEPVKDGMRGLVAVERSREIALSPRPEAVLHLAGRAAGIQVEDFVLRCRVFQPVGQGDEDRQGPSGCSCADPGADAGHDTRALQASSRRLEIPQHSGFLRLR
jgi:hypothetical protein